jgi:predicted HAD superfamily Cof-like phosphohydrolase
MNTIAYVREFHEAFDIPVRSKPSFPDAREHTDSSLDTIEKLLTIAQREASSTAKTGCRMCLRMALELEELRELAESMRLRDLEGALDAQVDRVYILQGTSLELGLAGVSEEAFRRVHAANMLKLDENGKPTVDSKGKVIKPPGWVAPDLSDLVL